MMQLLPARRVLVPLGVILMVPVVLVALVLALALLGLLLALLMIAYARLTGAYSVPILNDTTSPVEVRARCSDFHDPPPFNDTHGGAAFCQWYDSDAQRENVAQPGGTVSVGGLGTVGTPLSRARPVGAGIGLPGAAAPP